MTRVKVLSCLAAILCLAQTPLLVAQSQYARRLVMPGSSIARPEDKGLRAHTNFILSLGTESAAPSSILETPASIACIYKLVTPVTGCPIGTTYLTPTGGSGAIAIVDAYDDPNAASDLAVFSNEFGLPAANFSVVYASGSRPSQDPTGQWEFEESLDIEWAHAMAPGAYIYLVEAASTSNSDLFAAVNVASSLVASAGGGEVSMSFAQNEFSGETSLDGHFGTNGVLYVASSGDTSFAKEYPAMSPNVVAAGGTNIVRDASGNLSSEQYWADGGGGISQYESRPTYQAGIASIVGTHRGAPDISAVASAQYNGATSGVAVYDSIPYNGSVLGWAGAVGTSVSAPVLAGRLNHDAPFYSSPGFLSVAYGEYANATQYPEFFKDVTVGNANCKTGWDICNGIGVPLGYNNASKTPAIINFGTFNGLLSCTTSRSSTVTVTNTTPYTLSISSASLSNTNSGAFSVTNNCGSVAVNGSCTVTVNFHGTSSIQGANTGTLLITSNAWTSPMFTPVSATVNEDCNGH